MKENNDLSTNKELIFLGILMFFLILLVFGSSLAIFNYFGKGQTTNSLKTGSLTFAYSDTVNGLNGIYIDNALQVSDNVGKNLLGSREYFDFVVTATTSIFPISYEVVATKSETSSLMDEDIKIYLTVFDGNMEKETMPTSNNGKISLYGELHNTVGNDFSKKVIYTDTIYPSALNYSKRFRLRMWINDVYYDDNYLENKYFSVKVNVRANG